MDFSTTLRELLDRHGLKLREVAEAVGVTESAVSYWASKNPDRSKRLRPSPSNMPALLDFVCKTEGERLDLMRAYVGLTGSSTDEAA